MSGAGAEPGVSGWTGAEVHAALNEETLSARTSAVLERVGTVLGEREGTGPDNDLLLGSQRRRSRAEGRAVSRGRCWRRAASRWRPDSPASPAGGGFGALGATYNRAGQVA